MKTIINNNNKQKTGAIYVVDELDFEQKSSYELVIRAIDSVSGVSAEVPVSVLVTDVNDCPPELPQDNYNITVSESSTFGTVILKVQAQDNDMGKYKSRYYIFVSIFPNVKLFNFFFVIFFMFHKFFNNSFFFSFPFFLPRTPDYI